MTTFTYLNRFIYIIGGLNNSTHGYVSSIERLDTVNNDQQWERVDFKTNGWTGRYGMNSCQLSEQYFLIFGGANSTFQNHCYLYDA